MKTVHKSVLIWFSAHQMFDLVVQVDRYPEFLPWCDQASVVETHDDGVTAEIGISFNGIRQTFTTRNVHRADREVALRLVNGPFSRLDGAWTFTPVGQDDQACRIELVLHYGFVNAALSALVGPMFDVIAANLVDAFVKRADKVYG